MMILKFNKKIIDWLENTWKPTFFQLGLARILFCLGFIAAGLPHFKQVSGYDLEFFDPPVGVSLVLGPITSESFWWIFDIILRIVFVFVLAGFRTKKSSIIFGLLLIFGFSYEYSYGKINHNIFPVIFPIIMAFTNWGGALSIDSVRKGSINLEPKGWPLTFLSFLLGWGYFTAGLPKLIGGWLDPSYSSTAGFILRRYYSSSGPLYLNEMLVKINSLFVNKLFDYSTLIFELGFILTIFWSAVYLRAVGVAVMFHLGVLLTVNIPFALHVLVFLPYIIYFYFDRNSRISANFEKFLLEKRKYFIIVLVVLSLGIITDYNPQLFRFHRHMILFLVGIPSILMLLPKPFYLYFTRNKN